MVVEQLSRQNLTKPSLSSHSLGLSIGPRLGSTEKEEFVCRDSNAN